jgi:hypothetical protein
LALEIERYRRSSGITSRACALAAAPPTGTNQGLQWLELAGKLAGHQGVRAVGFDDLCVFAGQTQRLQEQAALGLLESRRWLGVLSLREIQTITRMPSLVLRRHVTFAALLLGERGRRQSTSLAPLQAEITDVRAHQAAHEAAAREASARLRALRGRPAEQVAAAVVRLQAKLEVHQAALARLALVQRQVDRLQREMRQEQSVRPSRGGGLHQLPVAIGLHSAYELARRDLEALLALERDPPPYLTRTLGPMPQTTQARSWWRDGVRLIERYRAQHAIDHPTQALGPAPGGHIAGPLRQEIADQLQALQVEIHRSVALPGPDLPGGFPEIDLGLT